jgi:hypothetical protein
MPLHSRNNTHHRRTHTAHNGGEKIGIVVVGVGRRLEVTGSVEVDIVQGITQGLRLAFFQVR